MLFLLSPLSVLSVTVGAFEQHVCGRSMRDARDCQCFWPDRSALPSDCMQPSSSRPSSTHIACGPLPPSRLRVLICTNSKLLWLRHGTHMRPATLLPAHPSTSHAPYNPPY